MGVSYNPKIVTGGLVLCLDAANANKSAKGFKNLLDLSTWTLGTGGVTGFSQNGTTAENQRILDTGPFGVSALVWDTPSNDATSDGDGGWDGASISIDKTKMYRFSVWMRRRVIGNGSYYLGCAGGVLNRSDGVLNNNPYFSASSWPVSIVADQWMLIVGHIWPVGSGTGTNHVDSGLWNTSGTKFSGPTYNGDFVWQTSSTTTNLRSYLYYSTDTTTRQQWYQPRIDLVDGTEPTVAELIAGVGSKWYDLTGTNHGNILNSAALYNSAGYMNFDGVDDYVDCGNPTSFSSIGGTNNITVSSWVYYTAYGGGGQTYSVITVKGNPWTWLMENPSNTFRFRITAGGSDVSVADTSTHALNTWYNVVGTYDGANMRIYVNGVLKNTIAQTGTLGVNSVSAKIGTYTGTTYNLTGRIANVSVYNRTLTASEIQQNFNAARGRFGI